MPIYEYSCTKCGAQFEVLIRSQKDLPGKCPSCGTPKPVKQFSSFAVSSQQKADKSPFCATCPGAGASCSTGACPCEA